MRLLYKREREFLSQLVDNTKALVNGELPLREKIDAIEQAVVENKRHIDQLTAALSQVKSGDSRSASIKRLIEIRKKAAGYLAASAKYLVQRHNRKESLTQAPRLLAVPAWASDIGNSGKGYAYGELSS
jgi:hypothetical protein